MNRSRRHPFLHRLILFSLTLDVTVYVLFAAILAWGAAPALPPFPFENTQQLGPGIPGLPPFGEPEMGRCPNGMMLVEFSLGSYTPSEGAHGWQVYVEVNGPHLTGAFYDGGLDPKVIYTGTVNGHTGHITVTRVEPYNPQVHYTPCDTWGPPRTGA